MLTVFENRVLRRIFGPVRDEVTVEGRKVNNEITKHYLGDQIDRNEIGWACGMYRGKKRCIHGCGGET